MPRSSGFMLKLILRGTDDMTLTEILPAVRQLPAPDKLKLIRILEEELGPDDEVYPFEPHKVYYLATPYGAFGAGSALMKALESSPIESK